MGPIRVGSMGILAGRPAVATGTAGGIGRAIATWFAAEIGFRP